MDKFNPKMSKEPRLSKTIVPPAQWIRTASAYDNMVQQSDIHR